MSRSGFLVLLGLLLLTHRCLAYPLAKRITHQGRHRSMSAPEGKFKTIAGHSIHYEEVSPEGALGGVTLLLLHGARFSVQTWLDLRTLQVMADSRVKTVAVDLPGFGHSPGPKESEQSKSDVLAEIIQTFVPTGQVVLVSPSMSGSYAVPYVEKHGSSGKLAAWVPVAPVGVSGQMRVSAETKAKIEVLVIYGDQDPKLPDADILTQIFPNSSKVVVKDGSHPCYLDDPELFHSELLKLVKRHATG